MNTFLLLIIGLPALEILIMIKIGQQVGAFNTIALIFLTAIIGIYYARIEGLNTIKSGVVNLYNNKIPVFEMISGASIAIAAMLLILPGFITDLFGFLLLFKPTRNLIINIWFKNKNLDQNISSNEIVEGEVLKKEKDKIDKI